MLSQRQIATIRSLHRKKERQKQGLFLVEGVKPVSELLKAGWKVRFIACIPERSSTLKAGRKGIGPIECDQATIDACSSLQNPEGVIAVAEIPERGPDAGESNSDRPLLCGEGLQDPGNLGTLLRIADHFDLGELLLTPDSVDPFNPKVVRSSMGSCFRQRVHRTELSAALDKLKKQGRRVVATDAEGPSIYSHPLPKESVLLFGNESQGLSDALKERADELRCLPALGKVESLNVAVSAGIFCSEILREEMP